MIPEVLLIADDLTGACDAAVQFANRGMRTRVSLHPQDETECWDVLAVNTESRDRELASFRSALAGLRAPSAIVFKKIDSTLRGNVGAEVSAAREAFGCEVAVVTPAFPAMGRVVEDGWLRIDRDPGFAPRRVAANFQGIEHCDLRDARTDEDLDAVVAEVLGSGRGRRVLWAGSAGLAGALARFGRAATPSAWRASGTPVFCLGSHHPVTLEQERRLRAQRTVRILRVHLDGRPFSPPTIPSPLVLSGGDTASLVCRALGVRAIDLRCEVAPGIPGGILVGGLFDGMPVVTKSGGFGAPDTLIEIANYFTCSPPLH